MDESDDASFSAAFHAAEESVLQNTHPRRTYDI